MKTDVTWIDAINIISLSAITSFFLFLLLEVVWGDAIGTGLSEAWELGVYVASTLIIFTGILFVIILGSLLQLIAFNNYLFEQKIITIIFTSITTLLTIFIISWLVLDLNYPEQKTNFEFFITIFAIYHLPSPIWVWFITLAVYHIILTINIKLFYVKIKK